MVVFVVVVVAAAAAAVGHHVSGAIASCVVRNLTTHLKC